MEDPSYRTVLLDLINWKDERFAITSYLSSPLLDQSLERWGMLAPPWLWDTGEAGCTIVDGFKRLAWARDRRLSSARCLVFPQESDFQRLMLLRLETKLCSLALNVAEKAQVLAALVRCALSENILQEYLPRLHLPARREVIGPWCRLAASPSRLLQSAALGTVCERAALVLADWEDDARNEGLAILEQLRCSASIQMEILEHVSEIALREGKPRVTVLTDPTVTGLLQDRHSNHRQKTQALRTALTRMRFPRLAAREMEFRETLARANLPGSIRLLPPPAFEGDGWQLTLSFSNPHELRRVLPKATAFASSPLLEEILGKKGGSS